MSEIRKQVLGRGLSSLLGSSDEDEAQVGVSLTIEIPIKLIEAGINQPRRSFPAEELQALSLSIRDKGVLQPILVRAHPTQRGKYEIVAGERRWRAAEMAKLETIPAIIREFSNEEALEVGLLENLQRQDLNPIEEAQGYHRLAEEFKYTQETISRIVGKSRSHIANTLRLLTLPGTIIAKLKDGRLLAGHARALIGCENPEELADIIVEKNLSVREAEALAKQKLSHNEGQSYPKTPDPEKEILRQHLTDLLDVPVDLVLKGLGGKIVINFRNPAELDQILKNLNTIQKEGQYPPGLYTL